MKAEITKDTSLENLKKDNLIIMEGEKRKTLQLEYDLELRNKQALSRQDSDHKSIHIAQQGETDLIKESMKQGKK